MSRHSNTEYKNSSKANICEVIMLWYNLMFLALEAYDQTLFWNKVAGIKCYFLPQMWPKSTSVLSPIWVTKDISIKCNLQYLPEHFCKPDTGPF